MSKTGARPLVLLTRPADRAAMLGGELGALGIDTLIWPVLDIQPAVTSAPARNNAQAILLTSPRAVEVFAGAIGDLTTAPAYCVGKTTAAAARKAGFAMVHDSDGDAADLAALVNERLSPGDGPLLYLRGRDVARDMSGLLPGFEIHAVEVYRAAPSLTPPPAVNEAICAGNLTAIAFFSPRAAAIFASALTEEMRAGLMATTAVVMSERVANKVNHIPFQSIEIAAKPTGREMHAAICGACGIAPPQNGICD